MKNVALMLVVCVLAFKASAQDATDALRYSQLTFGGTARGMGLAGAVGSLGADITDLSINPAGLGLYRSSEVVFTPSLFSFNDATNYMGTPSSTTDTKLGIENFGVVFTHKIGESYNNRYGRRGYRERPAQPSTSKWKTTSFAIAYNKLNNFNENLYYQGSNANSSITDFWAQESNGEGPTAVINDPSLQFDAGLAEGWLVLPSSSDSLQYSGTRPPGGVTQTEQEQISGSQSEFDISFGANYNDRLYLGVTLGVPTINYNINSVYTETANGAIPNDGNFYLHDLTYAEQLNTSGNGFNLKFGIIYKVNDYLRLGIAAHTPTWYNLQDNWNTSLAGTIDSSGTLFSPPGGGYASNYGNYNYSLVTPWRFVGSATILFKKYGFISADYEYVDYSQGYFNFNDASGASDITVQNQINSSIISTFAPASIFRVGAEAAIDIFRIRAGFAYYGSPYQAAQAGPGGDESAQSITGGVGLRLDHVFIDAAYVYSITNTTYYPYSEEEQETPTYSGAPYATAKNTTGNVVLSVGYKF